MAYSSKLRSYSRTPIVIVDDHCDVIPYIHRAIGSRHLPFTDIFLLHIDAHPDLGVPLSMPAENVYDKDELMQYIDIESWIMPLVYASHITKMAWIRPEWSNQLRDDITEMTIGQSISSHTLGVDCISDYYISDGTYAPTEELLNPRSLTLSTSTLTSTHFHSSHSAIVAKLQQIVAQQSFILDIDLDFFSTQNPFRDEYTDSQTVMLKKLFKFTAPKDHSPAAAYECSQNRRKQLDTLRKLFTSYKSDMSDSSDLRESCFSWLIADLQANGKDVDRDVLFNAGLVIDDNDLPHHISTDEEICKLIEELQQVLRALPRPVFITLARSSRDEYCPPSQVDMIQSHVLDMLDSIYGKDTLDIQYTYCT